MCVCAHPKRIAPIDSPILLPLGTLTDYLNWGQEYLLHLSGDIAQEYNRRLEAQEQSDDLFEIVKKIVPQLMSNHAESYAIDLLLEVDALESVEQVRK